MKRRVRCGVWVVDGGQHWPHWIAISALGVPFQDHEQGYSKNKTLSKGCAKAAMTGRNHDHRKKRILRKTKARTRCRGFESRLPLHSKGRTS
jgi:hypothetical protein